MTDHLSYEQMRNVVAHFFNVCMAFVDGSITDEEWHEYYVDMIYDISVHVHCEDNTVFDLARYAVVRANMLEHCTRTVCTIVWDE
jgi:hemerythrin-like domain-containing protein